MSEVTLRIGDPGTWVIFSSLSLQHQPARQGQLLISHLLSIRRCPTQGQTWRGGHLQRSCHLRRSCHLQQPFSGSSAAGPAAAASLVLTETLPPGPEEPSHEPALAPAPEEEVPVEERPGQLQLLAEPARPLPSGKPVLAPLDDLSLLFYFYVCLFTVA